jgi:HK97 family phage prohead protease
MSAATIERTERRTRTFPLKNVEFRETPSGGLRITGYASVFGKQSVDLGGGIRETIQRGAFKRALADKPDVLLLQNHDHNLVLGRTTNGSLQLREDPQGLHIDAEAADTSYARDLKVLMQRGDVEHMSFAFTVAEGGERWDKPSGNERQVTVTNVDRLYDVSIVTDPAYRQTSATMRARQEADKHALTARRAESLAKAERSLSAARDAREEL